MARKLKKAEGDETQETVEETDATMVVDDSAELVPEVQMRPSPPKRAEKVEVAPAKKFRAKNTGRILHRGQITYVKAGKVIDERFYDVDQLRIQGIELEPVSE